MPDTNMHIINISVLNNHLINDSVLNMHIKIPTNDMCSKVHK